MILRATEARRYSFAAILVIFACLSSPNAASATCDFGLSYHIGLGMDFLKEARAYEARGETILADAEWQNLGHEVEMTKNDIDSCSDESVKLKFYLLRAWDDLRQARKMARDDSADSDRRTDALDLLRGDLVVLYDAGASTYYRGDYVALKTALRSIYGAVGLFYCSPEQDDLKCMALEKAQKKRQSCNHDVELLSQAAPDYPEGARGLGVGQATVTVSVTIGPKGHIVHSAVAKEPFGPEDVSRYLSADSISQANQLLGAAALSAAQASRFSPKVIKCKSVDSTVLMKFTFDPNQ